MKITSLTESIFGAEPQIDEAAGVIRGVKALGRVSKNGREYTDQAMAECARLYDGAQINLNHPSRKEAGDDRPFQEGIGWLKNVSIRPDGIYGDLHYLKTHPSAPMLVEAAQRNPNRFGLSHNAEGSLVKRGSKNVVESVSRVRSLDIVQNPATNSGLFESEEPEQEIPPKSERNAVKKVTVKQLVERLPESHPARIAGQKLLEDNVAPSDATMPDYSMSASEPDGDEDGIDTDGDGDGDVDAMLSGLVLAAFNNKDIDSAQQLAQIKLIMKTRDELAGVTDDTETDDTSGDSSASDSSASNSGGMSESTKQQKAEQAEELLEAAGIKPSKAQIEAVASATSSANRKALIESWKAKVAAEDQSARPRKPANVRLAEAMDQNLSSDYPKDGDSFARMIGAKPAKV